MHKIFSKALAASCLCLAAGRAAAQAPETRNLATDTLQPANAKYYFPVSRLAPVNGQPLYVFITNVSERGTGVEFTWRNPLALPRPKPVFITSAQLKWVELSGHYYEPVRLAGESAHGLALRLQAGPLVELFDVATPKKGVPIPLPVPGGLVPILWTGTFSNKYNHDWYLRRAGQKTMTAVPKGKKFAPFLATYLADAPALATEITAGNPGYRHDDVAHLLDLYNHPAAR